MEKSNFKLQKRGIKNGQVSNNALGRDNLLLTWPADNQIGIAIHIIDIKYFFVSDLLKPSNCQLVYTQNPIKNQIITTFWKN